MIWKTDGSPILLQKETEAHTEYARPNTRRS